MNKSILVNWTFRSGSGAIKDYLSSRIDISSPFGDNEFRIVSDPMGLNSLYNFCYLNPGILNPSYGVEQFKNYVTKLQKYKVYISEGKRGELYNINLLNLTNKFIKNITKTNYYATPHYSRVNFSIKNKIKYSLGLKLKKKNQEMKIANIIIPKSEKQFIEYSKNYIKNVIKYASFKKTNSNTIVLDNAVDAINPIESSKFFINPKIIIVTRDPRDVFSSMKISKAAAAPNYNVRLFVNWYKHYFCNSRFKNILNDRSVLNVKFEKFINNFRYENKRLCKFLGIKENFKLRKNSIFNLEISRKNIGKSKKNLSRYEINFIEKNLKNHLEW